MGYDVPTKGRPAMPEPFCPRIDGNTSLSRPVEDKVIREEERLEAEREVTYDDLAEHEAKREAADWVAACLREEAAQPGDPTTVYLMHDEHDRLLYVGMTRNMTSRFAGHGSQQPWFSEVSHILTEHWPNRTIAARREAWLIYRCAPKYNRASGLWVHGEEDRLGRLLRHFAGNWTMIRWPKSRFSRAPGASAMYQLANIAEPIFPQHLFRLPEHIRETIGLAETA